MSSIVTGRVKFIDTSIIFQDKITGKVRSGQIKVVMSSIVTGRVKFIDTSLIFQVKSQVKSEVSFMHCCPFFYLDLRRLS